VRRAARRRIVLDPHIAKHHQMLARSAQDIGQPIGEEAQRHVDPAAQRHPLLVIDARGGVATADR
jgi:hypothetical protein